jgi:hypothetical protein
MDGEELPYPVQKISDDTLRRIAVSAPMTDEDEKIFYALNMDAHTIAWVLTERVNDSIIMHARAACTGIKPAMKNLAVFLKYS